MLHGSCYARPSSGRVMHGPAVYSALSVRLCCLINPFMPVIAFLCHRNNIVSSATLKSRPALKG